MGGIDTNLVIIIPNHYVDYNSLKKGICPGMRYMAINVTIIQLNFMIKWVVLILTTLIKYGLPYDPLEGYKRTYEQ